MWNVEWLFVELLKRWIVECVVFLIRITRIETNLPVGRQVTGIMVAELVVVAEPVEAWIVFLPDELSNFIDFLLCTIDYKLSCNSQLVTCNLFLFTVSGTFSRPCLSRFLLRETCFGRAGGYAHFVITCPISSGKSSLSTPLCLSKNTHRFGCRK